MLGIFKAIVIVAGLGALGYFTFFVPIGDRTLYRHLVGISKTEEAQELKKSLSDEVDGLKADVMSKMPASGRGRAAADKDVDTSAEARDRRSADRPEAPLSKETEADKRALRELLEHAGRNAEKP